MIDKRNAQHSELKSVTHVLRLALTHIDWVEAPWFGSLVKLKGREERGQFIKLTFAARSYVSRKTKRAGQLNKEIKLSSILVDSPWAGAWNIRQRALRNVALNSINQIFMLNKEMNTAEYSRGLKKYSQH